MRNFSLLVHGIPSGYRSFLLYDNIKLLDGYVNYLGPSKQAYNIKHNQDFLSFRCVKNVPTVPKKRDLVILELFYGVRYPDEINNRSPFWGLSLIMTTDHLLAPVNALNILAKILFYLVRLSKIENETYIFRIKNKELTYNSRTMKQLENIDISVPLNEIPDHWFLPLSSLDETLRENEGIIDDFLRIMFTDKLPNSKFFADKPLVMHLNPEKNQDNIVKPNKKLSIYEEKLKSINDVRRQNQNEIYDSDTYSISVAEKKLLLLGKRYELFLGILGLIFIADPFKFMRKIYGDSSKYSFSFSKFDPNLAQPKLFNVCHFTLNEYKDLCLSDLFNLNRKENEIDSLVDFYYNLFVLASISKSSRNNFLICYSEKSSNE